MMSNNEYMKVMMQQLILVRQNDVLNDVLRKILNLLLEMQTLFILTQQIIVVIAI